MKTQNKHEKIRLFENSFLEALTRTSPVITIAFYGTVITALLICSTRFFHVPFRAAAITYVSGFLVWTLFEYLMHRFLFHLISETPWIKRIPYMLHGVHHASPRDESRLFMPPVPGLIIVSVLLLITWLAIGQYAFSAVAGLINGYLLYAAMHYSMHMYKPPRMLRKLWAHHALHHYRHHDKAFGVTSRLWDRVFGTMPPEQESGPVVVGSRNNDKH